VMLAYLSLAASSIHEHKNLFSLVCLFIYWKCSFSRGQIAFNKCAA
jgi:hypothetical protein